MGDHEAKDDKQSTYFSSDLYDKLKFVAQILLPALGTLYFALAGIWGLAAATQVIGSITAVDTFLGVLLGISAAKYERSGAKYYGNINVEDRPELGKKIISLEVSGDPHDIANEKEVTFKVNPPTQGE